MVIPKNHGLMDKMVDKHGLMELHGVQNNNCWGSFKSCYVDVARTSDF